MVPTRMIKVIIGSLLALAAAIALLLWTTFRVYVPADKCLVRISKSGDALPAGQTIAGPGQKGIQRETWGPGRYFLNPITWTTEQHDLVEISAGDPATWDTVENAADPDYQHAKTKGKWPEVGILVNRVGKPAPP